MDRKTIRRYATRGKFPRGGHRLDAGCGRGKSPTPATGSAAEARRRSACEAAPASWIEEQVQLGRNAQSIYQDLVESYGFTHRYNSVKRFVRTLQGARARALRRARVRSRGGSAGRLRPGCADAGRERGKYRRP